MNHDPPDIGDVQSIDASLRAMARSLAHGASDGDDLVQEVWLRALKSPPREHGGSQAWLWTVMRNTQRLLARGERARARRERQVAREGGDRSARAGGERPLDILERDSLREQLERHVASLGEPYSRVVREHFLEERATSEIARRLGRPEVTVRVQLKRGLDALRSRLKRRQCRSWSLARSAMEEDFRAKRQHV